MPPDTRGVRCARRLRMHELRHRRVRANGIDLHVVESGAGPPVLLLHGFPDFWYSWRHQAPVLTAGGYRVIMPDLRGYNESAKPKRVSAYSVAALVEDAADLIESTCGGRAAVIGHDWGGVIAWRLAALRPALVERLMILNAPHPTAYVRELKKPRQLLRAWYVAANQLPWLPERVLRARGYGLLRRAYGRLMPPEDVERYVNALSRPGALTAALNYYRAAPRSLLRERIGSTPRVDVPTLVLWGERDAALDSRLLAGLHEYVADLTIRRFPAAGHFVHWHSPAAVSSELVSFLRQSPQAGPGAWPSHSSASSSDAHR